MNTITCSRSNKSPWPKKTFRSHHWGLTFDEAYTRQQGLADYQTEKLRNAKLLGIGGGGLGSYVYPGLVRKGLGKLVIADGDTVEESNLNRQLFFQRDLHQPKAFALAKNSLAHSILGCEAIGQRTDFDEGSASILAQGIDAAYVGVDNDQTRAFAARFFREQGVPVVFAGVNDHANFGYVFLQRAEGACLGCVYPDAMRRAIGEPRVCRSTPAAVDILQAIGALVLYAIDALLMDRACSWNFRELNLVGGESNVGFAKKLPSCPLCGDSKIGN